VGHRDRPKEREKKYIETIMQLSGIIARKDPPPLVLGNPFQNMMLHVVPQAALPPDIENYRSSNLN
jgi:hypothetical protein